MPCADGRALASTVGKCAHWNSSSHASTMNGLAAAGVPRCQPSAGIAIPQKSGGKYRTIGGGVRMCRPRPKRWLPTANELTFSRPVSLNRRTPPRPPVDLSVRQSLRLYRNALAAFPGLHGHDFGFTREAEFLPHALVNRLPHLGVLLQKLLGVLASLTEALAA